MISFMLLLTLVATSVVINAMPPPNANSHGRDKSNSKHANYKQQTSGYNRIGNDSDEDSDQMEMGWMGIKMHENGPNDGNMGNPMKWGTPNQYPGGSNGMFNNQYPGMTNNQYPGTMNNQYPRRSTGMFNNQYPGMSNNQYPGTMNNQYPRRSTGMFNNQYPGMSNNQYPGLMNNQYPGRSAGGYSHPTYNGDFTNHGMGSRGNQWKEHDTIPSGSDWKTRGKRQLSTEDNSKDSMEKSVENSSESPEDMSV